MADEFDRMMSEEFEPESFGAEWVGGIIGPDDADDHMALHLLEALVQTTAMMHAWDAVSPLVEPHAPGFAEIETIGMGGWLEKQKAAAGGWVEKGSPADIELMGWVRVAAGQCALALQSWLVAHTMAEVSVFVYLSGHGWYPFHVNAAGRPL